MTALNWRFDYFMLFISANINTGDSTAYSVLVNYIEQRSLDTSSKVENEEA